MRDYRACFDVHDIGQVLMAWTAHARALVDNVAPLPQGAAEGVLKHTERARLRALLALTSETWQLAVAVSLLDRPPSSCLASSG